VVCVAHTIQSEQRFTDKKRDTIYKLR